MTRRKFVGTVTAVLAFILAPFRPAKAFVEGPLEHPGLFGPAKVFPYWAFEGVVDDAGRPDFSKFSPIYINLEEWTIERPS